MLINNVSESSVPANLETQPTQPQGSHPNILSISVDDLNDWVSSLGGYVDTVHTPNLDALMARGTKLTNAFAQSPLCNSSRASVLSGMDPMTTRVLDNVPAWHDYIDPMQTLPAVFKEAGYRTAGAGKVFHSESIPEDIRPLLYDEWQTIEGDKVGGDSFFNSPRPYDQSIENLFDYQVAEWATEFLERPNSESPFFLSIGFFRPHKQWVVPQEYFDLYPLDEIVLPETLGDDLSDVPDFPKELFGTVNGDETKWKTEVQGYLASISFADAMFGKVMAALEASEAANNTIVALWSDHGYHVGGEKEQSGKFTLWEEAGRVPLAVVDPRNGESGQVADQVVSLIDIFPTLVDLAGIPEPSWLEGNSLKPILENPTISWNDPAVTSIYGSYSIRTDRWRYINYEDGSEELYDIQNDHNQWENLADDPAYVDIKAELLSQISAFAEAHSNIRGTQQDDVLEGTSGEDTFTPGTGADVMEGFQGDDIYLVDNPNDAVIEAENGGYDVVRVSASSYQLSPHIEEAVVNYKPSTASPFVVIGNDLDNTLVGRYGSQTLRGGSGNDLLDGSEGDDTLSGDQGDDLLKGGNGNDRLFGGPGKDILEGHSGDDILYGGGKDNFNGGEGNDTANFSNFSGPVLANLETGLLTSSAGQVPLENQLNGIENLTGSSQADELIGNALANSLSGGAGNDLLDGGSGNDTLLGGIGSDQFFLRVEEGMQTILDFEPGVDKLYLSDGLTPSQLIFEGNTIKFGSEILATLESFNAEALSGKDFSVQID